MNETNTNKGIIYSLTDLVNADMKDIVLRDYMGLKEKKFRLSIEIKVINMHYEVDNVFDF